MAGGARAVVTELFARVNAGEPEAALELVDPRARWSPTMWSAGGTLEGREGVRSWFAQFGPRLEQLRIDVQELEGEGNCVAVRGIVHDSREGDVLAVQVGWTFTIEDGLIAEGRAHPSWEEARLAAGLDQPPPPRG